MRELPGIEFLIHPLPGTQDQLQEKLKELANKINNRSTDSDDTALRSVRGEVKEIAVGTSHIALLLKDGRLARLPFSVISDRLDLSKNKNGSSKSVSGGLSGSGSGSGSGSTGSSLRTRTTVRMSTGGSTRRRNTATAGSRGVILPSSRPTPYVPEDLISQAQSVLQGRSRNLIIRELQRTNLDVNLAVNNLLSRDEEGEDDGDDSQSEYVPEDLMSLLDAGMSSSDHPSVIIDSEAIFNEDVFGYSQSRSRSSSSRRSSERGANGGTGGDRSERSDGTERDTLLRWRDRQYVGQRKWLESALRDNNWQEATEDKKKEGPGSSPSPLWLGDELEFWPEKPTGNPIRFKTIATLHSELLAVSTTGYLYQWCWTDLIPQRADNPTGNHPRASFLGLANININSGTLPPNDRVVKLSTSGIRASLLTESGRVATWMDESVSHICSKLEHPATLFPDIAGEKIESLHTCVLYTLVRTETGSIFWWGVLPVNHRKKLLEKYTNKKRATEKNGKRGGGIIKSSKGEKSKSHGNTEITVGTQVCLSTAPLYQAGSIGYTVAGGVPKVGQLLNAAWKITDTCRFRIIQPPKKPKIPELPKERNRGRDDDSASMPPPPSPASSTCSDGSLSNPAGGPVPSPAPSWRQKRSAPREEERIDEEEWPLQEVIFVEDSKNIPVGKVLKVDGPYCAVRFPTASTTAAPASASQDKTKESI